MKDERLNEVPPEVTEQALHRHTGNVTGEGVPLPVFDADGLPGLRESKPTRVGSTRPSISVDDDKLRQNLKDAHAKLKEFAAEIDRLRGGHLRRK